MPDDTTSPTWPLNLGGPVWACDRWADQVYPARTPRKDWLAWYTQTFNTVEGNSTFYALPTIETTQRWAEQSAKGFRFCFKFPRTISHELRLVRAEEETGRFCDASNRWPRLIDWVQRFYSWGQALAPIAFVCLKTICDSYRRIENGPSNCGTRIGLTKGRTKIAATSCFRPWESTKSFR